MIKILIKWFVKNPKDTSNAKVRESYGTLAGIVGGICNFLLFGLKLAVGLIINSISVISDAFNNLSDLASSIIAVVGAKLSNKAPDKNHPHGHGRSEYIATLIVSGIIFVVGIELLKISVDRIINPEIVLFSIPLLIVLSISILVKVWMYSYNRYIGKKINSKVNTAVAMDSLSDIVVTTVIILGIVAGNFIDFPIDGIIGVMLSLLIIYTGYKLSRNTIDVLMGKAADPKLVKQIKGIVLEHKEILGVHDLLVHDYGPDKIIASLHAEVASDLGLVEAHDIIDEMEKKVSKELKIDLVIHMDPVEQNQTKK
jgi:cation diffusion facilitator family transporter